MVCNETRCHSMCGRGGSLSHVPGSPLLPSWFWYHKPPCVSEMVLRMVACLCARPAHHQTYSFSSGGGAGTLPQEHNSCIWSSPQAICSRILRCTRCRVRRGKRTTRKRCWHVLWKGRICHNSASQGRSLRHFRAALQMASVSMCLHRHGSCCHRRTSRLLLIRFCFGSLPPTANGKGCRGKK